MQGVQKCGWRFTLRIQATFPVKVVSHFTERSAVSRVKRTFRAPRAHLAERSFPCVKGGFLGYTIIEKNEKRVHNLNLLRTLDM